MNKMVKCYFCKKEVSATVRIYVKARNNREKSSFRDLCGKCYYADKLANGYKMVGTTGMGLPIYKKEG